MSNKNTQVSKPKKKMCVCTIEKKKITEASKQLLLELENS